MNKFVKLIFPFMLFISLTGCSHASSTSIVEYDNHFYLWPTGQPYTTVVDTNQSSFDVHYGNTYEYLLVYKDGHSETFNGNYEVKNNAFYLYDTSETLVRTLPQRNYYQFNENITINGVQYTLIWHAQHIFD